jgi:hypothetical protein
METWKLSVERQLTLDEIERHCATRQSAFAPSVTLNPSGSMHSIGNRLLGAIEIDAHLGLNVSGMQPGFKSNLDALIAEGNACGHPLSIFSGYRSYEHQARLFAAPPRLQIRRR